NESGSRSHLFPSTIILIGMCARRNGVAEVGSIARWSFPRSSRLQSGVAGILNAGGRTKFSETGAPNEQAFSKFIPGRTTDPQKIDNVAARSCATIGRSALNDS